MAQPRLMGELAVVALEAENLPKIPGSLRPFAVFRVAGVAKRTKADYQGNCNPHWDDQVNMPIPHGHNNMKVQILTEDPKKGDLLVCEGNVDLSKVLKEGEHDDWIPLTHHGKEAGDIYLELTFYSANPPPRRQPTRLMHPRPPMGRGASFPRPAMPNQFAPRPRPPMQTAPQPPVPAVSGNHAPRPPPVQTSYPPMQTMPPAGAAPLHHMTSAPHPVAPAPAPAGAPPASPAVSVGSTWRTSSAGRPSYPPPGSHSAGPPPGPPSGGAMYPPGNPPPPPHSQGGYPPGGAPSPHTAPTTSPHASAPLLSAPFRPGPPPLGPPSYGGYPSPQQQQQQYPGKPLPSIPTDPYGHGQPHPQPYPPPQQHYPPAQGGYPPAPPSHPHPHHPPPPPQGMPQPQPHQQHQGYPPQSGYPPY
ncbi:hypothetical protein VTP01DRAFT_9074 [Rhizomucor pusillus]|uniref:uncharacterized protein n=1 Tax=Rhizomucor pusillus TaxID=4840 RepID=UPI0037426DE4